MFYHEMNRLGYDDVFIDDWGNVIGIVNGTQKDPVIMYNGHLDTVPECGGNSKGEICKYRISGSRKHTACLNRQYVKNCILNKTLKKLVYI